MVLLTTLATLAATKGLEKASEILVEELFNFYKTENKKGFENDEIEDIFKEYTQIAFKKNFYINSVAFRAQDQKISELYYPLNIITETTWCKLTITVDDNSLWLILYYSPVMIVDRAGMGKTTISQYLFNLCLETKKAIPIIVTLRNLSEKNDLWSYLFKQFDLLDRHLEIDDIKRQIKNGGFLIILDGLDEVKDSEKSFVSKCIQDLVAVADKNYYVLTSRDDTILSSHKGYQRFNVEEFDFAEAGKFLNHIGKDDDCSKELVEHIKNDTSTIREFIGNPLMLSLLYRSYSYNRTIPATKKEFYRSVYRALFQDHDTTKNGFIRPKRSNLSLEEFEAVIRGLGWLSIHNEQVEFDQTELLELIQESIESADKIDARAEDVLYDLLKTVPLFETIGFERYKWCHKSFSEYFAARCIAVDFTIEQKQEILKHLFANYMDLFRYENVFDFLVEMDPKVCRDYVFIPFLENILNNIPEEEKQQFDRLIMLGLGVEESAEPFNRMNVRIFEYIENAGYILKEEIPRHYLENLFCKKTILVDDESLSGSLYVSTGEEEIVFENEDMLINDMGVHFRRGKGACVCGFIQEGFETEILMLTYEKMKRALEIMRIERDHSKRGRFDINKSKKH